jgi:hypothetical protein
MNELGETGEIAQTESLTKTSETLLRSPEPTPYLDRIGLKPDPERYSVDEVRKYFDTEVRDYNEWLFQPYHTPPSGATQEKHDIALALEEGNNEYLIDLCIHRSELNAFMSEIPELKGEIADEYQQHAQDYLDRAVTLDPDILPKSQEV